MSLHDTEQAQQRMKDGAGLIGQAIPDMAGTQPRLNRCVVCSEEIISCAGEVCDPCATQIALVPIKFAPLDGTPLILFSDDFGKHLLGYGRYMRFNDGSQGWIASSFHCYNGDVWSVMSRPTHFMRLPANPVGCASVVTERSESSGSLPSEAQKTPDRSEDEQG